MKYNLQIQEINVSEYELDEFQLEEVMNSSIDDLEPGDTLTITIEGVDE